MYITLKDGRQIRMPTDEEDAAIHAAAMSDPDCPPMTDEELARLRPAREVLSPRQYADLTDKSRVQISLVTDEEDRARQKRKAGRPPLEVTRPKVTLRLEPPILEHLRSTGKGWQTRVNALLREAVEQGRI